jgi:hypothetical protein
MTSSWWRRSQVKRWLYARRAHLAAVGSRATAGLWRVGSRGRQARPRSGGCGHEVLLAAPANSRYSVPHVKETEVVPADAAITGDTITEMAHVARAYVAIMPWMSSMTTRSAGRCTGIGPRECRW